MDCKNHQPTQHRDGKPPWCRNCGQTADAGAPVAMWDLNTQEKILHGTASAQETLDFLKKYPGVKLDPEEVPMTIEVFITARMDEIRERIEGLPAEPHQAILTALEAIDYLVQWHQDWPQLVEAGPPEIKYDGLSSVSDTIAVHMSQQIEWLTTQEYIKKFGTDPAPAPLLRKIASQFKTHPDFNEEWLV